jgi:hypothetical protein
VGFVTGTYLSDVETPRLFTKDFNVVCFNDTALSISIFTLQELACEINAGEVPLPTPNPILPILPPGSPLEDEYAVTQPIGSFLDSEFAPYFGDSIQPNEPGFCVAFAVTISAVYTQPGAADQTQTGTYNVWGEVGSVSIENIPATLTTRVRLQCRGFTSQTCGEQTTVVTLEINGGSGIFTSATIDSISSV